MAYLSRSSSPSGEDGLTVFNNSAGAENLDHAVFEGIVGEDAGVGQLVASAECLDLAAERPEPAAVGLQGARHERRVLRLPGLQIEQAEAPPGLGGHLLSGHHVDQVDAEALGQEL